MTPIGQQIREARETAGMTQRAFAKHVGITNVHLCNIEGDKSSVSIEMLKKIAAALDCELEITLKQKARG